MELCTELKDTIQLMPHESYDINKDTETIKNELNQNSGAVKYKMHKMVA